MKKIIIPILLFISFNSYSQLNLNIGAIKTDLKNNAISVGITYLRSLDSIFGGQELFIAKKNSFFMVTPELDIQTGTEDAFSSIVLKATGLINVFKTHTVAGLEAPNYNKTFHSFPVSLGVETNNQFNNTNGILEAGWVPYYQSYSRQSPEWIKRTRFGVFLQAGYKFNADSSGIGGEVNESEEKEERAIFRAKGSFAVDTDKFIKIGGINIGLLGTADGWADIVNSAFYSKLEGRIRVYLSDATAFDVIFSSGSGAPLFNEAFQQGVGVSIKL
jgi:hypothetical protein